MQILWNRHKKRLYGQIIKYDKKLSDFLMDLLNEMKLYDLGIIANSDNLINGSYGIIIEDFSPTYYRKFDF